MSTAKVIEEANSAGIILVLNGDRLSWSSNRQPPPELLAQLRETKEQIIEHLRQQQHIWLVNVAALLDISASTLLEQGLIDQDDLSEQYHINPQLAAELIQSSPAWHRENKVRD